MSRFRAGGLHFLISLIFGLVLLALCWLVWYPPPMLMAIGGHEIFLLVVGIDVVLGPLLTLVVFKSGKKGMKLDFAIIVILQLGAMAYGVSTLLEGRPVYVAALGDRFQVVQASELTDENLAQDKQGLPWWGPRWVGTKAPTDKRDISAVHAMAAAGGGRGNLPQLHISYQSMASEILNKATDVDLLKIHNPTDLPEIEAWLKKRGYDKKTVKYQPIKIGAGIFVVFIDAKTAAIIGIAPFQP